MSDDTNIDISRRKVLGSFGAIGVASAGAGLGTTAYFNDTESFENNTLTAGELDLKVDWEEHYYDGSQDVSGLDVELATDGVDDGYVGFPFENPTVQVATDDVAAFMDATAIEAFPDSDNDGVQDNLEGYDACEDFADTSEDLDPRDGGLRTKNDDTLIPLPEKDKYGTAPLINLHDVKPGDFGELTLSFHLCDNPGYVWMQGDRVNAAENGITEPESKVDDPERVELLDEIRTTLWYDDGNNIRDGGGTESDEVDVMIVFDASGSMDSPQSKLNNAKDGAKTLVDALGPGARVGLVTFEDVGDVEVPATLADSNSTVKNAIDGISAGGSTAMGAGIAQGQNELVNGAGARAGARKVMVVLGNGGENEGTSPSDQATTAKNTGTTVYSIAYGDGADEDLMEDISSPPKVDNGAINDQDEHAFVGGETDISDIFSDIGESITAGEEIIFQGSLRQALFELADGNGIPLDATPDSEGRECFAPETNHFVGFEWRIPTSVGNEIQGDSVSFDLGFYTEQCRHNDGSGQAA